MTVKHAKRAIIEKYQDSEKHLNIAALSLRKHTAPALGSGGRRSDFSPLKGLKSQS